MTAQTINNIIQELILEAGGVKKAIVGRDIARMVKLIESWEGKVFLLQGTTDAITNRNVEVWINDFENIWDEGMNTIVNSSGYAGYSISQFGAGLMPTKEQFLEIYNRRTQNLVSKEFTKARLLSNSLRARFGQDYKVFYNQYEAFVKEGHALGLTIKQMNEKFLTENIYRQNINVIDSSGRLWRNENYSLMYSRTRSSEIQSSYSLSEMDNLDMDIVQISAHNTTTPICMQFEGKFYSRNGATTGIPVLQFTPPFHPNCLHILLPRKIEGTNILVNRNKDQNAKFKDDLADLTKAEKKTITKQEQYLIKNRR